MSDDARSGQPARSVLTIFVAVGLLGGLGVWSFFGREPGGAEEPPGAVAETPRLPRPTLPFALSARALPTRTDAGLPLVLLLEARDLASGAPVSSATLPEGLLLRGPVVETLEMGGVARPGGDARELLAGASFDANGTLALPLTATRPVEGRLSISYDDAVVAEVELAWLAPPDGVVLLLPGQRLEGGLAVGTPEVQEPGVPFAVRIVPLRDGAPAQFGCPRVVRIGVDGSVVDLTLVGEVTLDVVATSPALDARVGLRGLPMHCESASFEVKAAGQERRS
ncbi:MAG: hypothetical protein M9894_29510 [Planctomycetes bacterium]|nr:hypothetical protein [Planctomycetota bacterium]